MEWSRRKRIEENSSLKRISLDQMIKSAGEEKKNTFSVIVKADVHGSKEAIEQSLKKMNSENTEIKVLHSGVGEINESDVTLAIASDAKIFGFNVKANVQAKNLSKQEKIPIKQIGIIGGTKFSVGSESSDLDTLKDLYFQGLKKLLY